MNGTGPDRLHAIADAIAEHLDHHPLAADTADGVAMWWLGRRAAGTTLEQVERALALLVARGRLRASTLGDGRVLYGPPSQARQ